MNSTQQKMAKYMKAEKSCFLNAFVNQKNYYKDKNLKLRIGVMKRFGQLMYPDCPKTEQECEEQYAKYKAFSAHCWLEDEDGDVYDYWHMDFCYVNKDGDPVEFRLEGASKEDIKEQGYEYIQFPQNIQTKIFTMLLPQLMLYERLVKMGVAYVY